MHVRNLTIAFYIAFALWFTATRYSSPGFYAWLIAPLAQDILGAFTAILFALIALLALRRGLKAGSIPWLDGVILAGALVSFDLFWRFILSRDFLGHDSWDAFKLTSITLDIATPAIAALGIAALLGEFRRPAQQAS